MANNPTSSPPSLSSLSALPSPSSLPSAIPLKALTKEFMENLAQEKKDELYNLRSQLEPILSPQSKADLGKSDHPSNLIDNIITCLQMESHGLGKIVRELHGLPELDLNQTVYIIQKNDL